MLLAFHIEMSGMAALPLKYFCTPVVPIPTDAYGTAVVLILLCIKLQWNNPTQETEIGMVIQ